MGFERFQSICAECGRPVPAEYIRYEDAVYLVKNCLEHGESRVLASEDADDFERWIAYPSLTVPPRVFITEGAIADASLFDTECPLHCGPCKNHLMTACCVLLNVTDRCNQRCPYCFAEAEQAAGADPPLADIGRWLDRLIELGEERKFNIQLSGGEPTVRDDLTEIVGMCKAKGFEYVQLNTNGRKLAEDPAYARELKSAGLSTVFLQFDGVSDEVYMTLRGEPLLAVKKAAIKNCGAAGLPVTLVPTVLKNVNLMQTGAIIDFMLENITFVKGVHFQPASFFGRRPDERNKDGDFDERVTMFAVMNEIEKQTNGRIRKADLAPISTGHPLCCFCAAYMKEGGSELRPLSSGGSCCGPEDEGASSLQTQQNACCTSPDCNPKLDPLEIIRRDRDFVLNKWDVCEPETTPCCEPENASCCVAADDLEDDPSVEKAQNEANDANGIESESKQSCDTSGERTALSFDEALAMFKNNMFTVSGMAFMDETNLDAERLRRCRVQVFSPDERLIPFCAYYSIYNNQ